MKTTMTTIFALSVLIAVAGLAAPAQAADPEPLSIDQLEINQEEIEQGLLDPGAPQATANTPRSELMREVAEILAREADDIAAAKVQLAKAKTPATQAELERRIAAIKRNTELALLRLQIERALAAGDEATARSLERSIEHILDPPIAPVKVDRPTPDDLR